ncbi:glycoside hydrolase 100 family protein [Pelagicoccus sp. SDUM812002]|uniref:amylo-alpha-1,6-glucosidase n=1 Tax=Pelagicoccus sp. SDUM812002 TaxID=3041266 RepID=UPI00280FF99D|nr:glycoside hydrolase 100 family protein [Pelagicoccus sp. SDUM812002]MDQ8184737.1 glycoside hydrolase 100 family protein [Pelagicoccus sp. SDUM812002]
MSDHTETPNVEEAYRQSLALLYECSTPHGFVASSVFRKNYHSVWGRDGCICATAAFLTDDDKLLKTAIETVKTLASNQAPNGQIPSYLQLDENNEVIDIVYGGLGEITTIDANLWFMIACQTAVDMHGDKDFITESTMEVYRKVIEFLHCIDCNSCGLLEIPVAGDWTDILNRSYHVLYDETLWYRALKCASSLSEAAGRVEESENFERSAQRVKKRINADFWWEDHDTIQRVCQKYMIKNQLDKDHSFPFFQSHLRPFANTWSHRMDSFANVLAALMGIAPHDRIDTIIDTVFERQLHKPFPLRVLDPPIQEGDADADQLRLSDESAWHYHNGGIWPLAGGFWALLLKRVGRESDAEEALSDLATALKVNTDGRESWGFYEYFHGREHTPAGTPRLAWNGAAFLIAYQGIRHDNIACFSRGADY